MILRCRPAPLRGAVEIPGSKSHTMRALAIASLAEGESRIEAPLDSADTRSALEAFRALGAEIETAPGMWSVRGFGSEPRPPENVLDVGNSGTALRVLLGACALLPRGRYAVLTGDEQIRRRPGGPLARALSDLGATAFSTRGNESAPFVAGGKLRGGSASIEAVTSQYLTSLLLCCPLAEGDTSLDVPILNEKPYVEITFDWLRGQGVRFEHDSMRRFRIPGGQRYRPFRRRIAADFSSATFFLCAGALEGCDVTVRGLDLGDTQGDKAVIEYLRAMGAQVEADASGIRVRPGDLQGAEIDMNGTPDALPMMAALACFAQGETRLANVPQARIKETDRIAVMARELSKMGANVEELPDGLIVRQSALRGAALAGHGDHRIVMALAVAASRAQGESSIDTAEAMAVTFPTFVECMAGLGARLSLDDE